MSTPAETAAAQDVETRKASLGITTLEPSIINESGEYIIPAGAKYLRITAVGGGGSGGGGGSAAAAQLQTAGGGGAAGTASIQVLPVGENTKATVTVGAGGAAPNGGAAGGNPGIIGNAGSDTKVKLGSAEVIGKGGARGGNTTASSTAAGTGGLYGSENGTTSATAGAGSGGPSNNGGGYPSGFAAGGGGSGIAATATLGGGGGGGGSLKAQGSRGGANSGTAAGIDGVAGTANTGAGGGGGGGGAAGTGAGGKGGAGGQRLRRHRADRLMPEPYYATAKELQDKVKVDDAILPDDEAIELLTEAEDLIDARLGVRGIDPTTGRKVVVADYSDESWRTDKLRDATLEIAKALFEDPGLASRQRARYVSGDVSTNGFYGPAYGERCEALIAASGLRLNRARMSGSNRRGRLRHFK